MKYQRGIADLWLCVIGLIVILGLLYGLSHVWTSYVAKIDKDGYDRGTNMCDAAYKKRDNDAIIAANKEITRLKDEMASKENAAQRQLVAVDKHYQGVIKNAKTQHDADVIAIRNGDLRMRDPFKVRAGEGAAANNAGEGASAGSAGRCDGAGGGELSDETKLFLRDFARDADRVVAKLAACQAIVITDRVQINGWNEYGHPLLKVALLLSGK